MVARSRPNKHSKRFWRIRGHDRFDQIADFSIPVGSITSDQIIALLKCLAAKESLSYNEIIGAYVKRKTKLAHELLFVRKNGPYPEYDCGLGPSFTAIVVDKNGDRIKYPQPLTG